MVNSISMVKLQSIENKKGEVYFRKNLALQFKGLKIFYSGEPSQEQYETIIKNRIKDYITYFKLLRRKKILLSPYLELGAGIGQGAMLLENKFHIKGFTSDISFETLQLAPIYKKKLRFKITPIRICCDIYNLPFQANSIPFIFTFQTLHHLPDPYPVIREVNRVLKPGGYFYFNEEPIAQAFNLNLWRRDRNLKWFEKVLKYIVILHFISRIGKSEVDHDILEETFSLAVWEKALNIFDEVESTLSVFPFNTKFKRIKIRNKKWLSPPLFQRIYLQLFGGGIEALCHKKETLTNLRNPNLLDSLACPNCKRKPKIFHQNKKKLFCKICKSTFKKRGGVYMLLTKTQQKKLYSL